MDNIIGFVYDGVTKLKKTEKVTLSIFLETFFDNVKGLMRNKTHIHHSQVTGKILDYSRSFCNFEVRENRSRITVITHNIFRFDFFFLLKGIRTSSWRTRDIAIGCRTPTDINFVNICNQVNFIDTIKYFQ